MIHVILTTVLVLMTICAFGRWPLATITIALFLGLCALIA